MQKHIRNRLRHQCDITPSSVPRLNRMVIAARDVTHSPWTQQPVCSIMLDMDGNVDILVQFGQRVRQMREAKGLSQEQFADLCGLDRTYISGIERGKRNVALRNIQVIAKTMDVSISRLFERL